MKLHFIHFSENFAQLKLYFAHSKLHFIHFSENFAQLKLHFAHFSENFAQLKLYLAHYELNFILRSQTGVRERERKTPSLAGALEGVSYCVPKLEFGNENETLQT